MTHLTRCHGHTRFATVGTAGNSERQEQAHEFSRPSNDTCVSENGTLSEVEHLISIKMGALLKKDNTVKGQHAPLA